MGSKYIQHKMNDNTHKSKAQKSDRRTNIDKYRMVIQYTIT